MRSLRLGVSLRTRLTLWYGALLALTLLGFSALLYFTLERSLTESSNEALHLRAEQIQRSVLGPNVGILLQPEDVPPGGTGRLLDEFVAPGIYPQVVNARGDVIFPPPNLPGGRLPVPPESLDAMSNGQESMRDLAIGDANVRVLSVPLVARGEVVGAVQVGQSLAPLQSTMGAVARLLFSAGLLALLLAMAAGWVFTRRALTPVARITETARLIAATGDYRQRLRVARPRLGRGDELYFLAATFNDMIARLEQMLESQRRLLADTSHELRNPLTVIRGNLALLRRDGLPDSARREAVLEAEDETARMGRLVNDLLLLARADAGQLPDLRREPVDLAQIALEVVEQVRPRVGQRRLLARSTGKVLVLGDGDRLKQLIANLVENAVRYTADEGAIEVLVDIAPVELRLQQAEPAIRSSSAETSMATALLAISDNGIGIEPEDLPRVFQRFYRVDRARTRTEGGTGLGLPIAQYVVHAHGGAIDALSDGLGQGSTFRVRLPLLSWEPTNPPAPTRQRRARRGPAAHVAVSVATPRLEGTS